MTHQNEITVDYDLLDRQIKTLTHQINLASDRERAELEGISELLCAIYGQRPFPATDDAPSETKQEGETDEAQERG